MLGKRRNANRFSSSGLSSGVTLGMLVAGTATSQDEFLANAAPATGGESSIARPCPRAIKCGMTNEIPVALTIAGSDCSAGAGIQADLKTFQHFQVHGLTAVTCVVSETANIVRAVHPVPVEIVADQVALLLESFPVAAIKTGMLFSARACRGGRGNFAEFSSNRAGGGSGDDRLDRRLPARTGGHRRLPRAAATARAGHHAEPARSGNPARGKNP